jgi:hypothetical protein
VWFMALLQMVNGVDKNLPVRLKHPRSPWMGIKALFSRSEWDPISLYTRPMYVDLLGRSHTSVGH